MTLNECNIKSIFFSEFDPVVGPKILYQVPEEIIKKENFDIIQFYIIPRKQLCRNIIRLNSFGYTIIGYPVSIEGERFERNAYCFNCCFVLHPSANALNYENTVRKLAAYLEREAAEGFFLNVENKAKLGDLLNAIYTNLNIHGWLHFMFGSSSIHLQVDVSSNEPRLEEIKNCQVPIFVLTKSFCNIMNGELDLVCQKILPLIDGETHVSKIAYKSDVDINIVKDCLKRLENHKLIKLISLFQYSNVYITTPSITLLYECKSIQNDCLSYVSLTDKLPNLSDVFEMYCSMHPGIKLKDLCLNFNPRQKRIDEKKLIQFGLLHNFIRHLHKYPIKRSYNEDEEIISINGLQQQQQKEYSKKTSTMSGLESVLNGNYSYDDICTRTGLSNQELEDRLENDPSVVMCLR